MRLSEWMFWYELTFLSHALASGEEGPKDDPDLEEGGEEGEDHDDPPQRADVPRA